MMGRKEKDKLANQVNAFLCALIGIVLLIATAFFSNTFLGTVIGITIGSGICGASIWMMRSSYTYWVPGRGVLPKRKD